MSHEENRERIRLLVQHGVTSPSTLTRVSGLSLSTVKRILKEIENSNISSISFDYVWASADHKEAENWDAAVADLGSRVQRLENQVAQLLSQTVQNGSKGDHKEAISAVFAAWKAAQIQGQLTLPQAELMLKQANGNKNRLLGVIKYTGEKNITGNPIGYIFKVLNSDWQPAESLTEGESGEDTDQPRELTEEEINHKKQVQQEGRVLLEQQFRKDMARWGFAPEEIDQHIASGISFS